MGSLQIGNFCWCRQVTALIYITFDVEKESYKHHWIEMLCVKIKQTIPKTAMAVITLIETLSKVWKSCKNEACCSKYLKRSDFLWVYPFNTQGKVLCGLKSL